MIASVAFVTVDRVESLERTLAGYADTARTFGRDLDLVVADDSRSASYREASRERLRAFARRRGVRLCYAGEEEKRRYVVALARESGLAAPLIELALFGAGHGMSTAGANRNWLLLHTVGDVAFYSDDDVDCRVLRPIDRDVIERLVVTDDGEGEGFAPPVDFTWRMFRDLEAALRSVEVASIDPFEEHERLLGRRVVDVERGFAGPIERTSRRNQDESTIMITMNGLAGDVGTEQPWHVTVGIPELVARRRAASSYRDFLESRIVVRCARHTTITRRVGVHSFAYAADARCMLPPFFPVLRREDTLFGAMWRRCHPRGRLGFLPWAFVHQSAGRPYVPLERLLSSQDLAEVIAGLLPRSTGDARSPEAEMWRMGGALERVARAPAADFAERVRARWRRGRPWFHGFVRRMRVDPHAPPHWVRDLERIEQADRAIRDRHDGSLPFDVLRVCPDPGAARALTQQLVLSFGQLVKAWPTLLAAAARLRERGERPAVVLR